MGKREPRQMLIAERKLWGHLSGGPTPVSLDLRYSVLLSSTGACDVPPTAGDLGLGASARIIAPGNPDVSVLVARMNRRDANQMPSLGSNRR